MSAPLSLAILSSLKQMKCLWHRMNVFYYPLQLLLTFFSWSISTRYALVKLYNSQARMEDFIKCPLLWSSFFSKTVLCLPLLKNTKFKIYKKHFYFLEYIKSGWIHWHGNFTYIVYNVYLRTQREPIKLSCFGAFWELRNATISFVMSVCLSVRLCVPMEQLRSHWTEFHEILYLSFFRNNCRRNASFVTIWQESLCFT